MSQRKHLVCSRACLALVCDGGNFFIRGIPASKEILVCSIFYTMYSPRAVELKSRDPRRKYYDPCFSFRCVHVLAS